MGDKTLHNSDDNPATINVPGITKYGDPDSWVSICGVSSNAEGWMESTKAMEVMNLGCLVRVTTQQGDNVAEALVFVPGIKIGRNGRLVAGVPKAEQGAAP